MFSVVRGGPHEAGYAARQLLELVGIITNVRADPDKLVLLARGPKSEEFREAFLYRRVRFSALHSVELEERASELFDDLGGMMVHSDSGTWTELQDMHRTLFECRFLNRSPERVVDALPILREAVAVTAGGLAGAADEASAHGVAEIQAAAGDILNDDGTLVEDARRQFGLRDALEFN
jgi:hypothetical protein